MASHIVVPADRQNNNQLPTSMPPLISQPPYEATLSPPPQGHRTIEKPRDISYNLSTRHPLLIWIPLPPLGPPPSSVCGRKGSVATIGQGDLGEGSGEMLGPPPRQPHCSDLLSGVGGQFTTDVGRRLSWLVWNDVAAVEDNVEQSQLRGMAP